MNQPRIIYRGNDFLNPSFEGQGDSGIQPISWTKDTDGDGSSTFTKEAGAHDDDLGQFRAVLERKLTDTRLRITQDIAFPVSELVVTSPAQKLYFACWLRAITGTITGEIRIETRTAGDTPIDSEDTPVSLTVAAGWTFFRAELDITDLTSYDHAYVAIETSTLSAQLQADECEFGQVLDFPITKVPPVPGTTSIGGFEHVLKDKIDSRSASNVVESINPNDQFDSFDITMRNFRDGFRIELDTFWKWARQRGEHWWAFYLDKDDPVKIGKFHYPYLIMANESFAPLVREGLVRYDALIQAEQVLPFEITS